MKPYTLFAILCMFLFVQSCQQSRQQQPTPRDIEIEETEDELADKVIIPFTRTNGNLVEVRGELNGVPLNMWWDTGASMTCISMLELRKMAKENKIDSDDFIGFSLAQLADGSVSMNARFNVRSIVLPGRDGKQVEVNDIQIAVSEEEDAPVLLGSDVISRLGKHTFDEYEGVIIFDE